MVPTRSHESITGTLIPEVDQKPPLCLILESKIDLGCELSLVVAGTMPLTKTPFLWVGGGLEMRAQQPRNQPCASPNISSGHQQPCHFAATGLAQTSSS